MKRILLLLLVLLVVPKPVFAESSVPPRIYSLVVDRFMNGDEINNQYIHNDKNDNLPYGGDFQGIEKKLDYIKDMGFDTVQLSPVFKHQQQDYLGYKVTSYDKVDDVYGGEKNLKQLIKAVHHKHMKIIIDMPAVATDEFTAAEETKMNAVQQQYFKNTAVIDLNNARNQQLYKQKMEQFTAEFNVDGLSMYVLQNNIDSSKIFPAHLMTIAIQPKGTATKNFKYVQKEETTVKLANAFKTTDQNIPVSYSSNEILAADQFFMPRFTKYAADENMFPGTRIKELMSYLLIQKHPISMTYGTEIAMNGAKMPQMHQLLDFRTDKEVTDYLNDTSAVYKKYSELFKGQPKVILNKSGNQVIFYNTDKVDFVYNVNNSSKATNVALGRDIVPSGKMMSGLLIGDSIHAKDGKFHLITNREEAELYAVTAERGLNNGYLYAAGTIVILFSAFIITVARRSKNNKAA
ncbi:alpha-amylase family glycosyl hydrolase [Macrococcus equipercicus]|uniref:Glycosyl hydrolase family 13 catalytic domain-containing protein n=1 Tax=Macrococcus equipercicus TaxID=69967 RepID=A0A9Q9BNM7_9STAP|nr:alpha-amylase family glycosyl hydrolase [Macrococcus equipercicus]KAA1042575.1 hypothetical protein ERX35_001455 [Macrococcus equipercicus]UTH14435.1 hypothetical protein KFV11_03490 [Macrococcus equipercicus]